MASHIVGQHKYFSCRAGMRAYPTKGWTPSELDKALTELSRLGEKVLGFWQEGDEWIFKVMA